MPLTHTLTAALLAAPLLLMPALAAPAAAAEDAAEPEADLKAGAIMFRQCALCHGQHGQGILGGKYPRIGGMPDYYILNALRDYQSGKRGYDAMLVVGGLKTAQEADLVNLAAFISDLEVSVNVAGPEDGDAKSGKKLYNSDCKTCHGRAGEGKSRKESPPLRAQYHEYLLRQIDMFKQKQRVHAGDPEDETFADYEQEDLHDILAFIATFDDAPAAAGDDEDK